MRSYVQALNSNTRRREIPLDETPGIDDSLADTQAWHLRRIAADSYTLKEVGNRAHVDYDTIRRRDTELDLAGFLVEYPYVEPNEVRGIMAFDVPKVRRPGDVIPEDCLPTRLDPLHRVDEWQTKRVWRASESTTGAARTLGISRQELNRRVKRYELREQVCNSPRSTSASLTASRTRTSASHGSRRRN